MITAYFVETESSEEAYFRDSAGEWDVCFVRSLEEVDSDAVVISTFLNQRVDQAFLDSHPKLRFLTTRSTSTDHLDPDALRARGVVVSHVPHYGETTVAEHTFALILALSRRLREVMNTQATTKRFSYEDTRGSDLSGKTLGIIGMGQIGQRVTALARAFQMEVLASDVDEPDDLARRLGFHFVSLEDLLARSDIISLHATLSPRTYHILNAEAFARCKRGVLVVNTARGALIDTQALRDSLESGVVGGAGLDVLQDERVLRDTATRIIASDIIKHLRSDALANEERDADRVGELQELMMGDAMLQRSNVIFTPHVAFNSVEAVARRNEVTNENIAAFIAGKPINCIE